MAEKKVFKIGDKVKFVDQFLHIDEPRWFPEPGTIGTVKQTDTDDSCRVKWPDGATSCDDFWWSPNSAIEKVADASPFITISVDDTDERKIIARDKRTGKEAVARCNPEDKFCFKTGAKLALSRLFGEEQKTEKTSGSADGITREKLHKAVLDVMKKSELSDILKESPILFLLVPVIGKELEDRLFGKEDK